jgi:acetyl esterase/lipase
MVKCGQGVHGQTMTRNFAFPFAIAVAGFLAFWVQVNGAKAGLLEETIPSAEDACAGVTLSRALKYGDSDQNLVDVATTANGDQMRRPVLLFVAGESFTDDGTSGDRTMRDQAMCLAAKNGLVGVAMTYRRAPANPWPAGAKDVAAAVSWIHQNADLYNGDRHDIVVVGYSVGAFHVTSFLAHKDLQIVDSDISGVVLVSGIYRPGEDAGDGERAYLGTDASKYDARSGLAALTSLEAPIVLAWSTADSPRVVAQGKTLQKFLCDAGHCPRSVVLTSRDSPASVFDPGDTEGLAHKTQQLISQLQARGLP